MTSFEKGVLAGGIAVLLGALGAVAALAFGNRPRLAPALSSAEIEEDLGYQMEVEDW